MSRLSNNILYSVVGQICLVLLGFVAVKFVYGRLGGDSLGIIYVAFTLNTILLAVMDLGVTATVVKEVAGHVESDPDYVRTLLRSAAVLYWGAFVVVAAAVYALAPLVVARWVNLETLDPDMAVYALRVVLISAFAALPKSLYYATFNGLQRLGTGNAIEVGTAAVQQIGIVVVLSAGGDLEAVAWWIAASAVIRIAVWCTATATVLGFRTLIPKWSADATRRNASFTGSMFGISILSMLHMQADKVMTSGLLPIELFGIYAVAYGAIAKGAIVASAVAKAAFPSFSKSVADDDHPGALRSYERVQDFMCFGLAPAFAAVPFAAIPLFGYVLDPSVAALLLGPATALAVGYYMNATLMTPYVFSLASERPDITVRVNTLGLFVTIPATALLVWRFGLLGAGLSWVVYNLWAYSVGLPRMSRECLRQDPRIWFRHVSRPLTLAAVLYGAAWTVLHQLDCFELWALASAWAAASLAYAVVAWQLLSKALRETLIRTVDTFMGRS